MFRCTNKKNDKLDCTDVGLKSVLLTFKLDMDEHLFHTFHIQNDMKQLPLFFNLSLQYTMREGKENHDGLELNGRHQLMFIGMTRIYWTNT
jgi:hypothetical protein